MKTGRRKKILLSRIFFWFGWRNKKIDSVTVQ